MFTTTGVCERKKDILAKLAFYDKRDKNLEVIDTRSNWKEGDPIQWTRGGRLW